MSTPCEQECFLLLCLLFIPPFFSFKIHSRVSFSNYFNFFNCTSFIYVAPYAQHQRRLLLAIYIALPPRGAFGIGGWVVDMTHCGCWRGMQERNPFWQPARLVLLPVSSEFRIDRVPFENVRRQVMTARAHPGGRTDECTLDGENILYTKKKSKIKSLREKQNQQQQQTNAWTYLNIRYYRVIILYFRWLPIIFIIIILYYYYYINIIL